MTDDPKPPARPQQVRDYVSFRHPWSSLFLVALALAFFLRHIVQQEHFSANAPAIADLGVFAVAVLGLTLAVWRFGLEGRQAAAAQSLAAAAHEQAEAAKQQLQVARRQADAAATQNELAEKHLKGSEELAAAAKRQEKITGKQAEAAIKLACAADRQADTAQEQATAAGKQVTAAAKVAEAAEKHAAAAANHAAAAKDHAEAARRQAQTDNWALLHDRYQRAARMLGSRVEPVRIGGVYLLDRLAREEPKKYHLEVMRLFASFVRHPRPSATEDPQATRQRLRADVQAVMDALSSRDKKGRQIEHKKEFVLDLTRANLQGGNLRDADLQSANLERARMERADLTGADLGSTNLQGARLEQATLAGANLHKANVAGAVLAEAGARVIGLEQEQLDSCLRGASSAPKGLDDLDDLTWKPAT